ncbi:predicted membrane protein [Eubacterium sp. CAG:786]|nr:predicted membrane protein [Eubacterium sp. CAG:786]
MDSNEKVFGVLAYLGILFIIPLAAGKTPFSRYHANQGLVLFIANIAINVVAGILMAIPFIRVLGYILSGVGGLACFILMILGIVNAAQEQMKPLPVIGGIQILK